MVYNLDMDKTIIFIFIQDNKFIYIFWHNLPWSWISQGQPASSIQNTRLP